MIYALIDIASLSVGILIGYHRGRCDEYELHEWCGK